MTFDKKETKQGVQGTNPHFSANAAVLVAADTERGGDTVVVVDKDVGAGAGLGVDTVVGESSE